MSKLLFMGATCILMEGIELSIGLDLGIGRCGRYVQFNDQELMRCD